MRAVVDANPLVNFLLTSSSTSPIVFILRAAIAGRFRMLVASETIGEVRDTTAKKPYLAARISDRDIEALLRTLRSIADILPALTETIPVVCRDRKDDYLLAHAARAQADYLITGDDDLLVLGNHAGVEIVSPSAFIERLGRVARDDR